jgi:hypothetical protein
MCLALRFALRFVSLCVIPSPYSKAMDKSKGSKDADDCNYGGQDFKHLEVSPAKENALGAVSALHRRGSKIVGVVMYSILELHQQQVHCSMHYKSLQQVH